MEEEGQKTRLIEDFPWDTVTFHLLIIFSSLLPRNHKHQNGEIDWAISSLPRAVRESQSLRQFNLEGGVAIGNNPHGWGGTRFNRPLPALIANLPCGNHLLGLH